METSSGDLKRAGDRMEEKGQRTSRGLTWSLFRLAQVGSIRIRMCLPTRTISSSAPAVERIRVEQCRLRGTGIHSIQFAYAILTEPGELDSLPFLHQLLVASAAWAFNSWMPGSLHELELTTCNLCRRPDHIRAECEGLTRSSSLKYANKPAHCNLRSWHPPIGFQHPETRPPSV